jgi:hypothetical protein
MKTEFMSKAVPFAQYKQGFEQAVSDGRTSGPVQSEELINYTKLNWSRSSRAEKFVAGEDFINASGVKIPAGMRWYAISEYWCGDSAQVMPVIARVADGLGIPLRVFYRDEFPEVIENYLTNGGKAVPKLIAVDGNGNDFFTWGPRPEYMQKFVAEYKAANGKFDENGKIEIQKMYNTDKGVAIREELLALLRG